MKNHVDPQQEYIRPVHFTDPNECGLNNVLCACSSTTECAKAVAGTAFESFRFDFETTKVYAKLNGRDVHLITTRGYDMERELTIRELQIIVINRLKMIIGANS